MCSSCGFNFWFLEFVLLWYELPHVCLFVVQDCPVFLGYRWCTVSGEVCHNLVQIVHHSGSAWLWGSWLLYSLPCQPSSGPDRLDSSISGQRSMQKNIFDTSVFKVVLLTWKEAVVYLFIYVYVVCVMGSFSGCNLYNLTFALFRRFLALISAREYGYLPLADILE